ncbi:sulfatase-like hydrolase/transferase [Bacteroides xylanisolvens]|nr:sulfatase-like hydrolase/transferase [Bacteroides xylanisolvens]
MKNLITVSALLLGSQVTAFSQEQPNIVMLFVDDLGWADLGYNNPVFDTPNINKLKSDGLYFSRAYVAECYFKPEQSIASDRQRIVKMRIRKTYIRQRYKP